MKQIRFVLALVCFMSFFASMRADIMLVSEPVSRLSIQIQNLSSFPDYAMIGVHYSVNAAVSGESFKFKMNQKVDCYRNASIHVFAVPNSYLENKNINTINWQKDKKVIKTNLVINAKSYPVVYPMKSVELEYTIVGVKKGIMQLYKSMQTVKYNNDNPDVVRRWVYKAEK